MLCYKDKENIFFTPMTKMEGVLKGRCQVTNYSPTKIGLHCYTLNNFVFYGFSFFTI